jgi:RHS repeat-associated protein
LGQLVGAARGAYREVFEYDAAGSLGSVLHDLEHVARGVAWTVSEGNVLMETPEAAYDNDLHGRRTRRVDKRTGQETRYSWDCRDQLREVLLGDGRHVQYTYDAFGRRVRKEIVGPQGRSVTEFVWDRNVLAAELGREGGPRVFVHAPGGFAPMLQQEQGSVFTYVNDHHGMPKELIDEGGRVAWSATHSAWGEVVEVWRDPGATRAVETPFRMLGQYLDEETGLCYTRFRYFDAGVGRWISPDPLGVEGGENLFGWDGSPTNMVDPLGLAMGNCPVPQQIQDQMAKRGLPAGGEFPYKPVWEKNRAGTLVLKTGSPTEGPRAGEVGPVDQDGNVWLRHRDPQHGDHWDVQTEGGRDHVNVNSDGSINH